MLVITTLLALCAIGADGLTQTEINMFYNGVTLTETSGAYTIEASGLPEHQTDDFPTNYNPNTITAQVIN